MSLPRKVVPHNYYFLTRRCTQRIFLMRPDAETNNAFVYCLAEAARRFEIGIIFTCAMSNHHHTIIYDKLGNYPAFLEHFHKMFARCMNVFRGRSENFWSSEQASVMLLAEDSDVFAKLIYAATNPVNAHLVERAHQWPGVNALKYVLSDKPLRARRPRFFFRKDGPTREAEELRFQMPSSFGPRDLVVTRIKALVAYVEERKAAERRTANRRVIGVSNVLRQDWRSSPATVAPRDGLRPTIAAGDKTARKEALERDREFLAAYYEARSRWKEQRTFAFPIGTYWLRRFAFVPLEKPPRPNQPDAERTVMN